MFLGRARPDQTTTNGSNFPGLAESSGPDQIKNGTHFLGSAGSSGPGRIKNGSKFPGRAGSYRPDQINKKRINFLGWARSSGLGQIKTLSIFTSIYGPGWVVQARSDKRKWVNFCGAGRVLQARVR